MSDPTETPAQSAPAARRRHKWFRNLPKKQKIITLLNILIGVVALAYTIAFIVAVGQIWAVGLHAAATLYWRAWLTWPLYGVLLLVPFGLTLLALLGILSGIAWIVSRPFAKTKNDGQAWEAALTIVVVGGFLTSVAYGIGADSYKAARRRHTPVIDADKTLNDSKVAIARQRQTVTTLSDSAKALISGLDKTATDVQRAKDQVAETLTKLAAEQQAVDAASKEWQQLVNNQEDLKLQQQEVDRILHGRYVPTRDEIDRQTWIERGVSFLMGVIASLVATWVWQRMQRRKTTVTESSASTPPTSSSAS